MNLPLLRFPFLLLSCSLLCALAACGSRSGLRATGPAIPSRDAGPPEDAEVDALPDAPLSPPLAPGRLQDQWSFGTIRALCDLLMIQFCEDGRVMTRFQADRCDGETSVTDAPQEAQIEWLSETDFVLRDFGVDFLSGARFRWVPGATESEDQIEILAPGFPWTNGVRAESFEITVPEDFIHCR